MSDFKSDKVRADSILIQQLKKKTADDGLSMKRMVNVLISFYLEHGNPYEYTKSGKNKQHHAEMAQ